MFETRILTETITRTPAAVAAFLSDPRTLPRWAPGFFEGEPEDRADGSVSIDIPSLGGPARVRVDSDAEHGHVDIYLAPVDQPWGTPIRVRLLPNGDGTDLLWQHVRAPGTADEDWDRGVGVMARELATLRSLLDRG